MSKIELQSEIQDLRDLLLGQYVEFFCKTEKHGIAAIRGTIFGYGKLGKTTYISLYQADGGHTHIDPSTIAYFHVARPSDRLHVVELPDDNDAVQFRLFNVHEVEVGYIDHEDTMHFFNEDEGEEIKDGDGDTGTSEDSPPAKI